MAVGAWVAVELGAVVETRVAVGTSVRVAVGSGLALNITWALSQPGRVQLLAALLQYWAEALSARKR